MPSLVSDTEHHLHEQEKRRKRSQVYLLAVWLHGWLRPLMVITHSGSSLLLLPFNNGDIFQTVGTLSDRLQVDALKQDQVLSRLTFRKEQR